MSDPRAPSEAEVLRWFETLSNWGRWGADDELGTLNLTTPERRAHAAALVREGLAVSCAWEIDPRPARDHVFGPPQRFMLSTGQGLTEGEAGRRWAGASEYVGLVFHGYSVTHLDALSHYFWDGKMYNGRPASQVTSTEGATSLPITSLPAGITTRGVLLDVTRVRDVRWLDPGDGVFPDDLEAAESRQGVRVAAGDAVLLRTGYGARKREQGPDDTRAVGRAGWHVACLPWLRERDVALIGCDTAQDVHPSGYASLRSPVHAVGIVAMGLWLLDNCDLEDLVATCERLERFEFQLQLAPLRIAGATGSPVNPIALF
jgi:kynurenine formamidase